MQIANTRKEPLVALEIAIVLLVLWLPPLLSGPHGMLGLEAPPDTSQDGAFLLLRRLLIGVVLGFLFWASRRPLSDFGLGAFRLKHLAWALLILVVEFAIWLPFHVRYLSIHPIVPSVYLSLETVIVVLTHELLYRCYLQTRLKDVGWKTPVVVGFTAVLFGLSFLSQNGEMMSQAIMISIALGWSFFRLKSVWPGLIAQLLFNLGLSLMPLVYHYFTVPIA